MTNDTFGVYFGGEAGSRRLTSFLEQYPNYFRYKTRTTEGYELPGPTRTESVEVGIPHPVPARNVYTHKNQWNTYELEVTETQVAATQIDWRGNSYVQVEEISAVDAASIFYRTPWICDPWRLFYWMLNNRLTRFIRSQPLFFLVLILSWVAVFMSFNAASRQDKPVDVFRGSTYVFIVALFITLWLCVVSCCKDMRWCCYSQRGCCRGRCRTNINTDWFTAPAPPPRVGGTWISSMPERCNAVLREHTLRNEGASRVDAKEVYDAAQEARAQWEEDERAREAEYERKRGGGTLCASISKRTVYFVVWWLIFAVAALPSCGVALDWTYYKGPVKVPSCDLKASKWAYDFSCEFFDQNKKCKEKTASHPPALKNDSNANLAFACPGSTTALGSVIASHGKNVPDTTCGLCKSAFMPSYRACEVLKFFFALVMLITLCLPVVPQLPQRLFVYEPTPSAWVVLTGATGHALLSTDLGDVRNAKAAVQYLLLRRNEQRLEYLRAGHRGYNMLGPVQGTRGGWFAPLWNATFGVGEYCRSSIQYLFFGA